MGDDVGDHTWDHRDLAFLPQHIVRDEIERTAHVLERIAHRPIVFFRPPHGAHSPVVDGVVRQLHLLEILWSVDSRDSLGADPAQIAANVLRNARPGAIILLHENRGQTLKALLWLHTLALLRARGLHPVTLTQLLTSDPPSRRQLAAGPRGCGIASLSRGG
jgi:peptidoglycan-N-acetylglucosamine deacetylase